MSEGASHVNFAKDVEMLLKTAKFCGAAGGSVEVKDTNKHPLHSLAHQTFNQPS